MDNITSPEEAKQFLRGLGLTVDEGAVGRVVDILLGESGDSLYSVYAQRPGPPICGKGTVYKIKRLCEAGKLAPWVEYRSYASTTKKTTYGEETHARTLRALAKKLARGIKLPSLSNRELWDSLSLEFRPGKYCLSIGTVDIDEDGEIKVRYGDVGADFAAPCVVQQLHSHLESSGSARLSELVGDEGMLANWVAAVGQYSEAIMAFLKTVTGVVKDEAPVTLDDEAKPGLTKWFIITVWMDAIQQAGDRAWIHNSWYRPPSRIPNTSLWMQDCGVYRIAIARSERSLKTFRNWHKELRHHFAGDPLARRITVEGREIDKLSDEIEQRLSEFRVMASLPGHCRICRPCSELTSACCHE